MWGLITPGIQRLQRLVADTAAEQTGGAGAAELRGFVTRRRLEPHGPAQQQLGQRACAAAEREEKYLLFPPYLQCFPSSGLGKTEVTLL